MHLDGADRLHGIIFFSRDSQNSCSAGRMKRSRSFERSLERNPTFGSLQPFLQQSMTSGPAESIPFSVHHSHKATSSVLFEKSYHRSRAPHCMSDCCELALRDRKFADSPLEFQFRAR